MGTTGLASTFVLLFATRLLLGLGESVAYPCYSRIVVTEFPERHRGVTNAWIDAGTKSGPALGSLVGALLIAHFGWRALFVGAGLRKSAVVDSVAAVDASRQGILHAGGIRRRCPACCRSSATATPFSAASDFSAPTISGISW